jgi:hypothetical protein
MMREVKELLDDASNEVSGVQGRRRRPRSMQYFRAKFTMPRDVEACPPKSQKPCPPCHSPSSQEAHHGTSRHGAPCTALRLGAAAPTSTPQHLGCLPRRPHGSRHLELIFVHFKLLEDFEPHKILFGR